MHGPKTLIQLVKKQPSFLTGGSCIVLGKMKPDLDMCKLIILVDDAGGILPTINHSPWHGLTLVILYAIFPLYGCCARKKKSMPCRAAATGKAICWAVKLLVLGLFLQENCGSIFVDSNV